MKPKMKDFLRLPFLPIEDIPVGFQLIPTSSVFEGGKGYILIPPESAIKTEKKFNEFKEKLVNAVIEKGLKKCRKNCENSQ